MQKSWTTWSLNQWLVALEHRHVQEIQLGLDRISLVAKRMTSPSGSPLTGAKAKVISIAGTNGKGSTVSALEMVYHTAHYKVGTYTSPHLIRFNERIRVNVIPLSDDELCHAFCAIETLREDIPLTYFEMTTLAALWHFQQLDLDIIILEVGLGGRLDATNIVDADVAIITTIDYDHQEWLGDTLEAIGYEKAGILRQGTPFIYADAHPPESIIERAKELDAPGFIWEQEYFIENQETSWNFYHSTTRYNELPKPNIQLKSAAAALMASQILQSTLPITQCDWYQALARIHVPGRLQYQPGAISVLYDASHNAQSARLLAKTINQLEKKRVHAIFSALKDKDISGLLIPLKGCVDLWYPAVLDTKRASTEAQLVTEFAHAELSFNLCYNSPFVAFQAALEHAVSGDLIVVYGSFFTVGQVMSAQSIMEQKEII